MEIKTRYTIHDVAALLGISPDAIRLYEKEGLVFPLRDPNNGYRYYEFAQIHRILGISLYRQLGVGIAEIRVLSEQTKQSTENIEEIINKLDQNATDTITSMDHVMDKIGDQVAMIHEIEEDFAGIRSGMSDLKENSIHMSDNVRTLKESNTTLVDSTNTLSSTSEEVSASAEETNAMCADNAERFNVINDVLEKLTAETSRMDGFIHEYNEMQAQER